MLTAHFIDIPPLVSANGTVRLPGSKSISNRVLLLAALSQGSTLVEGVLWSEDTQVMIHALRQLGCQIDEVLDKKQSLRITGLAGKFQNNTADIYLANAGTAVRSLVAALSILGGNFQVHGVERMHERPLEDLIKALRTIGCTINCLQKDGFLPLSIGIPSLKLNHPVQVRGDVSSQFLSALLIALPLVAKNDIIIEVTTELISKPYIHITLEVLKQFGVQVKNNHWQKFIIPAGSHYLSPKKIHVEADASSASYFIALGAIAANKKEQHGIELIGIGYASIQGDIRFIEAAQAMGASIAVGENSLRIERGVWPLKSITLDCNHIPDAAMTLAIMALYAEGTTKLTNIASWRVKETDRIFAMATELRKLGAQVEEGTDYIAITPPKNRGNWQAATIDTYGDHRMAMCFSLAAFNPAKKTIRINDPACVIKTFPNYFETFFALVNADPAQIPVICIDGPAASGKGTLAGLVAQKLGFHFLDSGALYRAAAVSAQEANIVLDEQNENAIIEHLKRVVIQFTDTGSTLLNGQDISEKIRVAGTIASKIAVLKEVRQFLTQMQRNKLQAPGLVADGRDMGTVIFPQAHLKVFLTASPECRAQRRHTQRQELGISGTIETLVAELKERDFRDSSRSVAPMRLASDAKLLDNSTKTVEESIEMVMQWWQEVLSSKQ